MPYYSHFAVHGQHAIYAGRWEWEKEIRLDLNGFTIIEEMLKLLLKSQFQLVI